MIYATVLPKFLEKIFLNYFLNICKNFYYSIVHVNTDIAEN